MDKKETKTKTIEMVCPYGKSIIFRRLSFGKTEWERILGKLGVDINPKDVLSVTISGVDNFGRFILSVVTKET